MSHGSAHSSGGRGVLSDSAIDEGSGKTILIVTHKLAEVLAISDNDSHARR
jgi:ABC-type uncharacterized transport system ATPase subunit